MEPELLKADGPRRVVRVGDTIRRAVGWWTPAVHALLAGLERVGFEAAPRVLGIDDEGREVLTFIDGESGVAGWPKIATDEGLRRYARLLREYHDATRLVTISDDAEWALATGSPGAGEVICHTDFAPWNIVWRDDTPIAILDWDFAGPAPALNDVAYALYWAVPFRDDAACLRWHAFEHIPDRRRRIEVFADAYGLAGTGIVDAVIQRLHSDSVDVRNLAARGLEPQATWIRTGEVVSQNADAVRWIEENRALLE